MPVSLDRTQRLTGASVAESQEPLNNYTAVVGAVRTMTAPRGFGLSPAHITVSTVGVIPRMLTLAADLPGVHLALSLHAPTQALRTTLVPAAQAYPLERLMAALAEYQAARYAPSPRLV